MKKNKKILIATGIFPPDIGGPATMLKALVDALVRRGFEIKVITYGKSCSELATERSCSELFKVYRININSIFRKFKYWHKLKKLSHWADIIYTTETYSVGYAVSKIKKKLNKPYVLRFTGDSAWEKARASRLTNDYILEFQNKKYNKKTENLKKRRNLILLNADKVIVDCNFNKNLAQKIGVNKEKIQVIYNSVDFMNIKINDNSIQEIKNKFKNSKIIVTACRLMPWKGVGQVIKILPELIKKVGKINLLILGSGPELNNLKKITSELNLQNQVYFLGNIKRNEINNYFKVADIFVLNSDYEGTSHTLLEVLKVGTPIVTTRSGGNPEVIEDSQNGLLVDYGNNDELLSALEKILSKKISINSKYNSEKFNWERIIEKTIQVINF